MRVLGQHVRGQVVVLVLAVQQQQVPERARRERRVLQQEVELAERLVVQRDRVELLLGPRRHVRERLLRRVEVLHRVLDGGLEVERLDERGLAQHLRVAHAAHVDAVRVGAHAELRVLAHAALDDLGDVLERGAELLEHVVAQRDVVRDVALVAQRVHRVGELGARGLVLFFLVRHAREAHDRVRVVGHHLLLGDVGAAAQVVLLVLDRRAQRAHALVVLLAVDLVAHAHGLRVQARLVHALRVVDLVVLHVRVELDQRLVHLDRVLEVLQRVVAVAHEAERRAGAGEIFSGASRKHWSKRTLKAKS